ncbi:hypothetical protein BH23PLA1_BH23PLA1_06040 [soil metagenome]
MGLIPGAGAGKLVVGSCFDLATLGPVSGRTGLADQTWMITIPTPGSSLQSLANFESNRRSGKRRRCRPAVRPPQKVIGHRGRRIEWMVNPSGWCGAGRGDPRPLGLAGFGPCADDDKSALGGIRQFGDLRCLERDLREGRLGAIPGSGQKPMIFERLRGPKLPVRIEFLVVVGWRQRTPIGHGATMWNDWQQSIRRPSRTFRGVGRDRIGG